MQLIIVESPTKARTLSKFLGGKYKVEATMGHIRDLPKAALGVDVEHNFLPKYVIPKDKQKRVGELMEMARKAEQVILATDPDREGEAIAWHVSQLFHTGGGKKSKKSSDIQASQPFQRIVFHEITESAIREALEHARVIDQQLVDAQQARRILDRLVGYKLSPLLWQKLSKRWLSAGRVQSVAVRLIVEREREINKFQSEAYWSIEGVFHPRTGKDLTANLVAKNGIKYEKTSVIELFDGNYTSTKTTIVDEQSARQIIADLAGPFAVTAVDRKETRRAPAPPYTTSTLQQDAGRKLYFSSKKTMQLAQKLYEEGHITYHRTDSVNLAAKFIGEARDYLRDTYGVDYLPDSPRRYQTKSKVAQEAHEAIRPTDVRVGSLESRVGGGELNRDHLRLYELIWKRALASQAKEAVFDSTVINIKSSNGYEFTASGSVIKFDGFLKIIGRDSDEVLLPAVGVGETVNLIAAHHTAHKSNPPPRYTEASLVKTLEEKDIGRPSTYAPIISTIIDRHYVEKQEKKLAPTDLGGDVTDFLVRYFPDIMELPFTAGLESSLDEIAGGSQKWEPVVADFYRPFAAAIDATYKNAVKVKAPEEPTDEFCPKCESPLVIRIGRYGKFVACSTFPKCDYTRQHADKADIKCPRCGKDIVVKKSRRGKSFYGCSGYPTCTFAAWKKEDIK